MRPTSELLGSQLAKLARVGTAVLATAFSATESNALATPGPINTIGYTTKIPYEGRGVWAQTDYRGYYLGRANYGDGFEPTIVTLSGKAALGLITDQKTGIQHCGYVEEEYIKGPLPPRGVLQLGSACVKYYDVFKDRSNIFKGANGPEGLLADGTFGTDLVRSCDSRAYFNLALAEQNYNNMNYPEHGTGPYDLAGKEKGPVHYRATVKVPDERGRRYAMVRSDKFGWVFIRKSCIRGFPQGGTLKEETRTILKSRIKPKAAGG
jgi:hypothetical protein